MTKKLLAFLSGCALVCLPANGSTSLTTPKFVWGNLLTGVPGQDQCQSVTTYGKDAVYFMATDGSVSDDTDVTYGDRVLYQGAQYTGTSANKNLTVLKTDAAGEMQWVVYSNAGDFTPNEGQLAVCPDGKLVVYGTVRTTDGDPDAGIKLVDGKGNVTDLAWDINSRRSIRPFLAVVTAEGEIEWARTFEVSTEPVPAATGTASDFTANAVNASSCCVDSDGNIIIAGRFRNPMTFPCKDGSSVTLTPKNTVGWNGDSQKACGDLFVVKLDGEGNYLTHLVEGGDAVDITYVWDLAYADGSVYMVGYAKGSAGATFTLGGVDLKASTYTSPLVARLSIDDLKPEWIEILPSDAVSGKQTLQSIGLSVSDSFVWLAGMYNGKISDPADAAKSVESTQGNLREGFIIKLDADNGNWLAAANSRTDFPQNYLTGYLRILTEQQTGNGEIIVYGYAMNATVGVFLRSYNPETLAADTARSWSLVSQGGVPTACGIAYVPELATAYITVRGNKAFHPYESTPSESVTGYTNYLARFDLPLPEQSAVNEISIPVTEGPAAFYDLQGRPVLNPSAPGLYIMRKAGSRAQLVRLR